MANPLLFFFFFSSLFYSFFLLYLLEYCIFQDDLAKLTEHQSIVKKKKKKIRAQLHNHWIMHSKLLVILLYVCVCVCVCIPPTLTPIAEAYRCYDPAPCPRVMGARSVPLQEATECVCVCEYVQRERERERERKGEGGGGTLASWNNAFNQPMGLNTNGGIKGRAKSLSRLHGLFHL